MLLYSCGLLSSCGLNFEIRFFFIARYHNEHHDNSKNETHSESEVYMSNHLPLENSGYMEVEHDVLLASCNQENNVSYTQLEPVHFNNEPLDDTMNISTTVIFLNTLYCILINSAIQH